MGNAEFKMLELKILFELSNIKQLKNSNQELKRTQKLYITA